MKAAATDEQRLFVIEYLRAHYTTDVCDAEFHQKFHQRFGGKISRKNFGAQPVHKAMRLLARMWKEGALERSCTGLSYAEAEPGFPRWVHSYYIKTKD